MDKQIITQNARAAQVAHVVDQLEYQQWAARIDAALDQQEYAEACAENAPEPTHNEIRGHRAVEPAQELEPMQNWEMAEDKAHVALWTAYGGAGTAQELVKIYQARWLKRVGWDAWAEWDPKRAAGIAR